MGARKFSGFISNSPDKFGATTKKKKVPLPLRQDEMLHCETGTVWFQISVFKDEKKQQKSLS